MPVRTGTAATQTLAAWRRTANGTVLHTGRRKSRVRRRANHTILRLSKYVRELVFQ
jgi:hypothetical protein